MMVTALLIPRLTITSIFGALGIVIGIALVNAKLWDAALFFSVPDSFTVHTATLLIANGLIFWILVKLLPGIQVEGLLPALAAPVVFTGCSMLIGAVSPHIDLYKTVVVAMEWAGEAVRWVQSLAADLRSSNP